MFNLQSEKRERRIVRGVYYCGIVLIGIVVLLMAMDIVASIRLMVPVSVGFVMLVLGGVGMTLYGNAYFARISTEKQLKEAGVNINDIA